MKKKNYTYGRIKAILIDDDIKSIKFFSRLCEIYFPEDIHLVASYDNPIQALEEMGDYSIDIIFLDVEMPKMDGFDFISALSSENKAKVVLVSSHSDYALKAFRFEVFDYLSKPVSIIELRNCINRYDKSMHVPNVFNEDYLKDELLIINRQDKAVFVVVNDIIRIEANGSYTDIFMENGIRMSSTKNIMYYEERLNNHRFYKVHRSHLVNLSKIKELIKNDGDGIIVMQDNSKITISRSKKNEFLRTLTR